MIRLIRETEKDEMISLLYQDKIVNYFVLLGFFGDKTPFAHVYGLYSESALTGVLAIRTSGNAQLFMTAPHPEDEIMAVLKHHKVKGVIAEKRSFKEMAERYGFEGAFQSSIMTLEPDRWVRSGKPSNYQMNRCKPQDAARIKALYTLCFEGSLSERGIKKNLETGQGRGLFIAKGERIIAVAQTIFEDKYSAILYGVATDPAFRQQGYSSCILDALLAELIAEDKTVMLMVENPVAKAIYASNGFIERTSIEKYVLESTHEPV